VIVMVENEDFSTVVGSPAMPFLNSLATQNALATNYFANTHPSMGTYFMLTVGQLIGDDSFAGTVTAENVVRELTAAGKTWKTYQQSIPSAGYLGGDVYPYVRHHNPFAYLSDVINNPAQQANIVPLTNLASDLSAQMLPNYAFIVPDDQNNAHDCPVGMATCTNQDKMAAADAFLAANVPPILNNAVFQQDGVLLVLFDEADDSDVTFGGGHIFVALAGPKVKKGFQSATFYQHQSVLRLSLQGLGINTLPGAAASAPVIQDVFGP
jgi:acid phosphatase